MRWLVAYLRIKMPTKTELLTGLEDEHLDLDLNLDLNLDASKSVALCRTEEAKTDCLDVLPKVP